MKLIIINGPNLNLLGTRQPEIYGELTMEEIIGEIKQNYSKHDIQYFQSNHEGALIDKLQEVGFEFDGIILNAGAYTHTSIAIADAISSITTPVLELHISNINERESFRQHSYLKPVCVHHIIGIGTKGYAEAVDYFIQEKSS